MSAPTILFVSGRLWSTVPVGVQDMVLVSWFDLCAAFSVRPWSLSSGHPWSDGSSRPWPRQSGKSGKQASYGVPGRRRGVKVGSSILGQVFRSERPPGGGWRSKRVLWSERWAEEVDERVFVPLGRPSSRRPDCPSGPLCFRLLGRPMNYMLFSWAEPWCGSRSPRNPGFINPTSCVQRARVLHHHPFLACSSARSRFGCS